MHGLDLHLSMLFFLRRWCFLRKKQSMFSLTLSLRGSQRNKDMAPVSAKPFNEAFVIERHGRHALVQVSYGGRSY